jgi:hypothetical protein
MTVQEKEKTPVRLSEKTKHELRRFGKFGQSYDDIVWELIKSYKLALKMKAKKEENKV